MSVKVSMCQDIHSTVAVNSTRFRQELNRHNYVTPTSYLELLAIFSKLVGTKKHEVATARDRTKTGLDKVCLSPYSSRNVPSPRPFDWQLRATPTLAGRDATQT